MRTKQCGILALCSTLLAVGLWLLLTFFPSSGILIATMAASLLAPCFITVFIVLLLAGRKGKTVSKALIFGIADLTFGLATLIFALWDIATDTGWFAGLLGTLLLITAVPLAGLFLLIDILCYVIHRNKNKGKDQEPHV